MEFPELDALVSEGLVKRCNNKKGLAIFIKERAKFEGWLKLEICDILSEYCGDVFPERDRIDVTFGNWAIELKTVNTNYRVEGVKNKHRPITMNIDGVIEDIEKLRKINDGRNKAVLFMVFPFADNDQWGRHINRITKHLDRYSCRKFDLDGTCVGIYLGQIK